MSVSDPFLPDRRVRVVVLGVAVAALLVFGWINVRGRARLDAPQGHRSDFTVYTAAATAVAEGRSPYDAANASGWGYIYPPLFAILVSPFRDLAPTSQAWSWFLVTMAAALGSYRETVRLVTWADEVAWPRAPGPATPRVPGWLALTSVATIFSPGIATMKWGQVGILLLYLLLLGTRLIVTSRRAGAVAVGGLMLSLAVAIKLSPMLPAACLLSAVGWAGLSGPREPQGRQRFLGAVSGLACGLALCLVLVPSAFVGWRTNSAWLHEFADRVVFNLGTGQRSGVDVRTPGNHQLSNAMRFLARAMERGRLPASEAPPETMPQPERVGYLDAFYSAPTPVDAGPGRAVALALQFLVAAAALAATAAFATERPLGTGALAAMAFSIVPTLLFSPIAWSHHYVLLQPASVFVPLWFWQRGARGWAATLAGWLALSVVLQFLLLPHPWRVFPWLPFPLALWVCAAAVIAWRVRTRTF
jgi:hypothetical protein